MLSANLIPLFGVAYALVAFLLLIGPILLLWMVYRTLRDGVSSKKTFDAHWYEDREL